LDHIWLYIDYSSDYGETFTTYFHDLDSTITAIKPLGSGKIEFSNYPNPFIESTTIKFYLPENNKNTVLNIYNNYGILIRQYNITGKNEQQWDGKDNNGNKVKEGFYLYNIKRENVNSQFKKLLIVH